MTTLALVKRNQYFDSVTLLQISAKLTALPGVETASAVMATDLNRQLLAGSGLATGESEAAGVNDLVVALRSIDDASGQAAMQCAEQLLRARQDAAPMLDQPSRSLRGAARRLLTADALVAVISVPGRYAAAEAWQALSAGMHVFLFSDNVPAQDEVELKRYAVEHELLMMGPDCGTAILNGIGFGFANSVRRGNVGLIGASGTGLQEISVLIHQAGGGISHVIGCGSHDLSDAVGGLTTLHALRLLAEDAATETIVLVSKPPADAVARRVLDAARHTGKDIVACFLGWTGRAEGIALAGTLEDAARLATNQPPIGLDPGRERAVVLGAYCGGTLASEARLLLPGSEIVDFGDDQFTNGRAHPMIDPTLRNRAILESPAELVLLDFVLGTGAHEDPAGAFVPIIEQAGGKRFFGHVAGTDLDRQGLDRQKALLANAGVTVFDSNAAMARAAQM